MAYATSLLSQIVIVKPQNKQKAATLRRNGKIHVCFCIIVPGFCFKYGSVFVGQHTKHFIQIQKYIWWTMYIGAGIVVV